MPNSSFQRKIRPIAPKSVLKIHLYPFTELVLDILSGKHHSLKRIFKLSYFILILNKNVRKLFPIIWKAEATVSCDEISTSSASYSRTFPLLKELPVIKYAFHKLFLQIFWDFDVGDMMT